MRPRNSHRSLSSRTPLTSEPIRDSHKDWVDPRCECAATDLDVCDARLRVGAEGHHEAVDTAGFFFVVVDKLFVQHVAHEVDSHPPIISSGIEMIASTKEMTMMMATTELLTQPLRCFCRYFGSFIRSRKGTMARGNVADVNAIDITVIFNGS